MSENKVIVVGIGGATRSGKSTLTNILSKEYNSFQPPCTMDKYFLPREKKLYNHELKCVDNESPESIDKEKFLKDFEDCLRVNQEEVCLSLSLSICFFLYIYIFNLFLAFSFVIIIIIIIALFNWLLFYLFFVIYCFYSLFIYLLFFIGG